MTATMIPSAGSSSSGSALAWNNRGRAVVTPGDTEVLVTFTAGSHRLRGFHVIGDENAFVWIEVDAVPLDGLAAVHSAVKEAYRILPNAEVYASPTATVTLKVTNTGDSSAEFEAVVFGE